MDKKTFLRKIHPWRNCIAAFFSLALIAACVLLLARSRYNLSRNAIRSSEIFRRYGLMYPEREYDVSPLYESDFHEDFKRIYAGLYGETPRLDSESRFSFGDGDIVGVHSGGRSRNPEGYTEKGADARRWVDARLELGGNSRIRLYGAGSVGLQTGNDGESENRPSVSSEKLSVGGGFGFSYRVGENTELLFDYRHSTPLNSDSAYRQADAAGITLRFSF